MAGISELKDIVIFVAKAANVVEKIEEDGKVDFRDSLHLLSALGAGIAAVKGANESVGELADLSDAESEELIALFKTSCDLKNDNVELYAEMGVEAAIKLARLFVELRGAVVA